MKPGVFEYVAPTTVEDALAVLAERGDDTSLLAGGQSLMPLMNMRLARPEVLLDLNGLNELASWGLSEDGLRAGALVRAADLERSREVRAQLPTLVEAISHIGHPQIRNRTTIGGNVAHADPSSELPGMLAALEGSVELTSSRGSRTLPWSEFFVSVFMTAREPDEMVTAVTFPVPHGWDVRFSEMARRHGDFPIVALTVAVRTDDDVVTGLRVAATGVSDRPVRLTAVEKAAVGRRLEPSLVRDLVALSREEIDPQPDGAGSAEYRRYLLGTLLERSLLPDAAPAAA
ncbi:FAD binding domain-containing protein [Blastococcus sp. PRF04-17]|uniref:FAD binding domain-containing protein n=1 Tax=Blastococcus sp. PRF04-17 TaxID=2933797 RepID=UPI001FF56EC2|nr:xanthine dehydrogenase family protein subunit M [Blastococcus sp. PRF04-17]UOY02237.1 xanthine dehydrogenase family protein subunit M [Blastococcus sp. PRF04-17]